MTTTLTPNSRIDRWIEWLSPKWAAERAYYRGALASYRGAVPTRADTGWSQSFISTRTRERSYRQNFRSMRDRARQLERDNVLAGAVLDRAEENVIGTGIRVRAMSSSPEFNQQVTALWKKWTTGKVADIRHWHTFATLQRKFYRAKLRDGDAGCLLTEEKDFNGIPQPRLQILEGEHIDGPYGTNADKRIIDGVELNGNNAAVAFWLRTEDEDLKEIPLRVRSRDFIFLSRPPLYSSVRGESAFNGGWTLFDQIVGFLENVVMASRAGAAQALLITKNNAAQAQQRLGTTTNGAGQQQKKFAIEPLMVHYLSEGEDVRAFEPKQPQQNFPDAIAAFARFVGLRFGLTLEQILLDFSRTSYSSARAARLQAEQTAYQEQEDFNNTFLARVYPWVVSKWVKTGQITVPAPPDAWAYEWIPQGKPWVDPTKEIQAAAQAVALGVDSRSHIAMERGYDFRELTKVNQEDVKLLSDAGLPTDPTGATPPAPVVVQQDPGAANA